MQPRFSSSGPLRLAIANRDTTRAQGHEAFAIEFARDQRDDDRRFGDGAFASIVESDELSLHAREDQLIAFRPGRRLASNDAEVGLAHAATARMFAREDAHATDAPSQRAALVLDTGEDWEIPRLAPAPSPEQGRNF